MQAQTFSWVKTPPIDIEFNTDYIGYCNAVDAQGNIYFAGLKDNAVPLNELLGNVYYTKYDSNGNELLSKIITGDASAYAMTVDADNNVIVSFGFYDSITIDDHTEVGDPEEIADMRFLLVKFDENGTMLWHHRLQTDEEYPNVSDARGLTTDANGNIYVAYDNYNNSYITKYTPDGVKASTIVQQNVARVTSVSVDTDGNIYAAGACASPQSVFGGTPAQMINDYNIYVVKYSAAGQMQWLKDNLDITCPDPKVVAYSPNEVYFCSYLFGTYPFDDIVPEGPLSFGEDFFIAKLNAQGQYQWVQEVPGDGGAAMGRRNTLSLDANGNIYMAGYTTDTVQWTSQITTTVPMAARDALVLKYNPQGQLLAAITAGGEGYNRADAVAIGSTGDVYMAGMANSTVDFGDITIEAGTFENYPYLAKIAGESLGVNNLKVVAAGLYPNPANSYFYINGLEGSTNGSITNTLGQKVADFNATPNVPVNISHLPQGTYFIQADGFATAKLIKN